MELVGGLVVDGAGELPLDPLFENEVGDEPRNNGTYNDGEAEGEVQIEGETKCVCEREKGRESEGNKEIKR